MRTYLLRRLIHTLLALVLLVVIIFLFSQTVGDPVRLMLPEFASEAEIEAVREHFGFNDPLYVQFGRYAGGLLRLDLGTSLWQRQPVLDLIMRRMPPTFVLALTAIALASLLGVVLGIIAARWAGSTVDRWISMFSTAAVTSIDFWIALLLIFFVSVRLGWLPTSGYGDPSHIVLPALVVAIRPMGRIIQVTRPAVLDELHKPYILALRARGLSEARVLAHAGKNAGIVVITLTGYEFSSLVSGSAIVETVFAWPGVGFLLVQAITLRDWPVVVGTTLIVAMMTVLINLVIDLLYAWLDPRIRYT